MNLSVSESNPAHPSHLIGGNGRLNIHYNNKAERHNGDVMARAAAESTARMQAAPTVGLSTPAFHAPMRLLSVSQCDPWPPTRWHAWTLRDR